MSEHFSFPVIARQLVHELGVREGPYHVLSCFIMVYHVLSCLIRLSASLCFLWLPFCPASRHLTLMSSRGGASFPGTPRPSNCQYLLSKPSKLNKLYTYIRCIYRTWRQTMKKAWFVSRQHSASCNALHA